MAPDILLIETADDKYFLVVEDGKMKDNGLKFWLGTFRLDIRKTFFTRRAIQLCEKAVETVLPYTVLGFLSLEFSKTAR